MPHIALCSVPHPCRIASRLPRPACQRSRRAEEQAGNRAAYRVLRKLLKGERRLRVARRAVRGVIQHIARALLGRLNAHLPQQVLYHACPAPCQKLGPCVQRELLGRGLHRAADKSALQRLARRNVRALVQLIRPLPCRARAHHRGRRCRSNDRYCRGSHRGQVLRDADALPRKEARHGRKPRRRVLLRLSGFAQHALTPCVGVHPARVAYKQHFRAQLLRALLQRRVFAVHGPVRVLPRGQPYPRLDLPQLVLRRPVFRILLVLLPVFIVLRNVFAQARNAARKAFPCRLRALPDAVRPLAQRDVFLYVGDLVRVRARLPHPFGGVPVAYRVRQRPHVRSAQPAPAVPQPIAGKDARHLVLQGKHRRVPVLPVPFGPCFAAPAEQIRQHAVRVHAFCLLAHARRKLLYARAQGDAVRTLPRKLTGGRVLARGPRPPSGVLPECELCRQRVVFSRLRVVGHAGSGVVLQPEPPAYRRVLLLQRPPARRVRAVPGKHVLLQPAPVGGSLLRRRYRWRGRAFYGFGQLCQ